MFLKTQIEGFSIKIILYDSVGAFVRNVKWGNDLYDLIKSGSRFINDEGEYTSEEIDVDCLEFEVATHIAWCKLQEETMKKEHVKNI